MKQLVPTSLDEYIAEHKEGDVVTGRDDGSCGRAARVELGEGIHATARLRLPRRRSETSATGWPVTAAA